MYVCMFLSFFVIFTAFCQFKEINGYIYTGDPKWDRTVSEKPPAE